MKILFVYSLDDIQSIQKPLRSWASIQFGISYISAVLKAAGHKTSLVVVGDNQWGKSQKLYKSAVEEFAPDLICFSATYSQYCFIEKVARFTKNLWPEIYLLIGGVHATLNPNEVILGPFDAVCLGEGEYPTLELCEQLENDLAPHDIRNLWIYSRDGTIERNQVRDFISDLDQLPLPDREIWLPWIKPQLDAEFAILLGRGCPYNCSYCSNHALRRTAQGNYVRFRSPEQIVREITYLYENHQPRRIYLEVETIAANKAWALELCHQIAVYNSSINNQLSFGCNFRISSHAPDEKLFSAFKRANFNRINIGLESGSEKIRHEVLQRHYSNQDFLKVVAMARKYGISIHVYNMIGLPGETVDDHLETVALNRQVQPDQHYTGIFFPYPGTELFDQSIERGLLQGPVTSRMERRKAVIDLPHFTKAQIQHAYNWFDYRIYRGYKPRWVLLIRAFITQMRSYPTTNYLFRQIVQLPGLRRVRAQIARI